MPKPKTDQKTLLTAAVAVPLVIIFTSQLLDMSLGMALLLGLLILLTVAAVWIPLRAWLTPANVADNAGGATFSFNCADVMDFPAALERCSLVMKPLLSISRST